MSAEPIEAIRHCAECGREWRPGENWGWKADLTDDDPPDVAVFCPECAERSPASASRPSVVSPGSSGAGEWARLDG